MKVTSLLAPLPDAIRCNFWSGAITRESRDTLFLLATIGWIVLMQAAYTPWVTTLVCFLVLGWRTWLTLKQKAAPSHWIRAGLVILSLTLTAAQFRTIIGREAGSALLLLLLTFKTLELKSRRDAFVIFFLGFFTLLSHFFFSQSLLTALGVLMGLLALLTALVNAHTPAGYPPLRQSFLIAMRMVLLGTPLMIVLFLLFPRFAPIWGFSARENAKTGLSNQMTVGTIAALALDDSTAFRVRFDGNIPRYSDLYFRGPVLSRLDAQKWTSEEIPAPLSAFSRTTQTEYRPSVSANTVSYEVLLQPHQMQWLLTLDMAIDPPILPAGWRTLQMQSMQWVSHRPIIDVLRYRATSQLQYHYGQNTAATALQSYLALPPGLNPRTHALAQELLADPALAKSTPEQQVQTVLKRLRTGGYTYTLAPGLTGENAADTFWFDSKQGFCEHIANAFVVLMRNMHIPARIVTGYQGGDINPLDGMLTVRQSDAHAWAEVWLPEKGWVRIDPTAAISATRIENSTRITSPDSMEYAIDAVNPQFAHILQRSLQNLRNIWDATNTRWNSWILNYTQDRQLDLLKKLGFSDISWGTLIQMLAALLASVASLAALWAWYERHQIDPWLDLLQQARRRLASMGLNIPVNNALTPRKLLELLRTHTSSLKKNALNKQVSFYELDAWEQWLLALEAWRYSPSSKNSKNLRKLKAKLRKLPSISMVR